MNPFVYTCYFNETGVNISASLDSCLESNSDIEALIILKYYIKDYRPFCVYMFFNETGVNISASLDSSLEKENLSHAVTPSSSEPSKK